ncbi:vacuolar protein sorting-associated protein 13B [Sinocyclocheilus grahami]|uniref:vacuolar protein sorting-associated protein 13B n=2 Tax=Sinocyclocheilus TaxID=75365 RepID=UPI0007AD56ED|nr:PREDICTED: vacuolar protein sorting-associated protein 13B [Sinocyclocheilus grahami]
MLESYVSPLLMSYVNRYIKNLKPSDLQLSLWGGDVVLSKLDLRLDVLEQELKLPFTFLSGHIHELRIHVPWTKLSSEPVVITINTMECILKLRDGATVSVLFDLFLLLSAGYVQSLIRRVVNNVNIVVNNLILKYVEDDIVLSVNITSAECYTVDDLWDRAFMDIIAPELVLRKVINFSDCTVCLDKRNASGKIEFYQDPLLYKCSFRTRLHFTYDNINAKIPAVIKVHTMVESLKLSLTDQQLPMFIRLMELGVALYYGEMGVHRDAEKEESGSLRESVSGLMDASDPALTGQYFQGEDEDEGWMSWAWSFVPAIVSTGEEEGEGESGLYTDTQESGATRPLQNSPRDPIVSVGFYCTKASVTFKLTESCSESSYYSPQKLKSREVLSVEQEGITVEALMMGEPFFDCQVGVVGCRAVCLKGIMGVRDFEENRNRREEDAVFFRCGDTLSVKGMTYLTNSLFDYRSPENNGVRAEFILDGNLHRETYTENTGLQRYGAFYMDYLYTMENSSRGAVLLVSVQGVAVNVDPVLSSWLLFHPQRTSGSRQTQQVSMVMKKRREDEASVGSTPLTKQPSNQASDYTSSPVKTKTVELQSCCVFMPSESLPSPSRLVCGDIPGTVRSWYHSQACMPGTLVLCLPQISVLSAGHRRMEPLQDVPFTVPRPVLEEGDAFPWTVCVSQLSIYSLLGQQRSLSVLEPVGCTSTLALTAPKLQPDSRDAFIMCLHVDLQSVHLKCSNPQVLPRFPSAHCIL